MSERFIRVYKKFDIKELKKCLMIYGALSASCANCNKLGIPLEADQCPDCGAVFKYVSFQKVREHLPKLKKLNEARPNVIFIDYDDFKRLDGEIKAQEFLK